MVVLARECMKMRPRKRIAFVLFTLLACVGCDQRTKFLARDSLQASDSKSFLADTIRLDYTENAGGFWGLGSSVPAQWRTAVFTIGCSVGTSALLLYTLFAAQSGCLQVLALSLICAGGIGNLIDRWAYGYTRDFLNLGVGPVRTGIFNIADAALMAGCFLILLSRWLEGSAHWSKVSAVVQRK
jgi:signal peptidase II